MKPVIINPEIRILKANAVLSSEGVTSGKIMKRMGRSETCIEKTIF